MRTTSSNHGAAWLPKAAESGIDDDDDLRYEYAERGEPDAQVRLGHLYVQGRSGAAADPVTGETSCVVPGRRPRTTYACGWTGLRRPDRRSGTLSRKL